MDARPHATAPDDGARLLSASETASLATLSNYQVLLQGSGEALGVGTDAELLQGVGQRKLIHKTAEQRRRDGLNSGYDELRELLPACPETASKLDILRQGVAYLRQMRARVAELEAERATWHAAALTAAAPPAAPPAAAAVAAEPGREWPLPPHYVDSPQ